MRAASLTPAGQAEGLEAGRARVSLMQNFSAQPQGVALGVQAHLLHLISSDLSFPPSSTSPKPQGLGLPPEANALSGDPGRKSRGPGPQDSPLS